MISLPEQLNNVLEPVKVRTLNIVVYRTQSKEGHLNTFGFLDEKPSSSMKKSSLYIT